MRRQNLFWLSLGLFLSFASATRAEEFPNPTVTEMCRRAQLIVEGTWQGEKRVAVSRIWKAPDGFDKEESKELVINGLDRINRNRWFFDGRKYAREEIKARDVTLFLEIGPNGEWKPLNLIEDNHILGSPGVVWRNDNTCYHYFQDRNPAPYRLDRWQEVVRRNTGAVWVDIDLKEIRQRMEISLNLSAKFREALLIRDRTEQTRELIKYLSPRTSPDPKGTYRFIAEEALQNMPHLPPAPIIDAIKAAPPEEDLHSYLSLLWFTRDDEDRTQPQVVKILMRKDHNADSCIVTLKHLRDSRSIPYLRPFLKSPSATTRYLAAGALTLLRDQESYEAIAEQIPAQIKRDDVEHVKELLDLLYFLDKARTLPIAKRIAADPVMEPVRKQIRSLQKE